MLTKEHRQVCGTCHWAWTPVYPSCRAPKQHLSLNTQLMWLNNATARHAFKVERDVGKRMITQDKPLKWVLMHTIQNSKVFADNDEYDQNTPSYTLVKIQNSLCNTPTRLGVPKQIFWPNTKKKSCLQWFSKNFSIVLWQLSEKQF